MKIPHQLLLLALGLFVVWYAGKTLLDVKYVDFDKKPSAITR